MKLKMLTPWKESYDQPRQLIHYFANKGPSSQGYGFSSAYVWMWESDCKESWAPNNWCFWTVVLEKTLESPLDCKEIHPVRPKGHQSWVFIGRTDVKLKSNTLATWCEELIHLKRPWCWERLKEEEKGMAKDEMVEWHHQLDGHEFEQAPRVGDRQGSLALLKSMGLQRTGHHWSTELNWTFLIDQPMETHSPSFCLQSDD